MLAANMICEAAAMVTQVGGEIIPSNKPGTLAMGVLTPPRCVSGHSAFGTPRSFLAQGP